MKPNLPESKIKYALVDRNISSYATALLESFDIKVIKTYENGSISDSTSTHPDMQFALLDEKNALVYAEFEAYYKSVFPQLNIIPVSDICSPYPNDTALNFTVLGNKCFITNYQLSRLPNRFGFDFIKINQGYSKCNICILNKNAIITSDRGILENASNHAVRAYYLPDNEIRLDGYKNGFWGGCTGLIDKNKLFFNGNIEKLTCYSELLSILDIENIEPVYYKDAELCDNGSILCIY